MKNLQVKLTCSQFKELGVFPTLKEFREALEICTAERRCMVQKRLRFLTL
jgi:hypothetical protein